MKYYRLCLAILFLSISASSFAQPCTTNGSLVSVTYKKNSCYETITLKFKQTCATPTLSVATPPFIEDPSGNTITVNGSKFFQLLITSPEWTCKVPLTFNNPITSTSKLRALKRGGQFEGIFSYYLGLKSTANIAQVFPNTTTGGYCYIKYIIF